MYGVCIEYIAVYCMYIYIYIYIYTYICICMYIYIHENVCILGGMKHALSLVHVRACVHARLHARERGCVRAVCIQYISIYIYVLKKNMYIYIYTYIYVN